jgi:nucleotide-binding universal stress UspA family protein
VDDQTYPNIFSPDLVTNSIAENADNILQALCINITRKDNIDATLIKMQGAVSTSIIQKSIEWEADLIVLGAHGASGYRHLFIGSNAYAVIKNALSPVLVIPSIKKWATFKKVIFPARPIPGALNKAEFLRSIISGMAVQLEVVGLSVNRDEDDSIVFKEMTEDLKNLFTSEEVQFITSINYGNNIADDIIRKCTQMNADLLIITSSIDISRNYFYIGPHSQQIIHHSNVPILSIRKTGTAAEFKRDVIPT